ncbi:unnamed protein product [Strongylus vulgaris]|uniref:G-protein coupled receptors family 1 profile domain-containing protein n=1 Tax=Strongylus vulgaris TaxID=40348 RepID=A0A3P7L880_STRVU|nr:unnamed protein product [Strongylus vulgaris]
MLLRYVEYVSEDDVIADIAMRTSTSATTLLLASYVLNIVLLTTIYTSKKFRTTLIYVVFAHISLVNLLDLSFSVMISLLFVANGNWIFGDEWCKISAAVQELDGICRNCRIRMEGLSMVSREQAGFSSKETQDRLEACSMKGGLASTRYAPGISDVPSIAHPSDS